MRLLELLLELTLSVFAPLKYHRSVKKTPKKQSARLTLRCEQCQGEVVVFGQPEQFRTAHIPALCPVCAPTLYEQCRAFHLYAGSKESPPPTDILKGQCDPRKALTLCHVAENISASLFTLACNGNRKAAEALVELTSVCVDNLHKIAESYPEVLRPIAHQTIVWPFFISKKQSVGAIGKRLLVNLEVGKNPLIGGKWHSRSRPTLIAQCMFEWLNKNADVLRLPTLSQTTLPVWFEIGWRRLLAETKGQPHEHPYLKPLAKVSDWTKRAVRVGLDEATDALKKATIISKIKSAVAKGFYGHFPNLPR